MSILLLTNERDLTTDFLVREFNKRNLAFNRLNTDILVDSCVALNPLSNTIEIKNEFTQICDESISVAYFRRPTITQPKGHLGDYREYVLTEWIAFLQSLYVSIGDRWFSHPDDILLAENKPRQLRLAHEIGFNIPETVITNDIDSVKEISEKFHLVAKPLKQALIESEDANKVIFTSIIETLSDEDRNSISVCPVIFQRHIPKKTDIRVTVVGNQVFAVAIHSQETHETKVDWRRGSNPDLRHEVVNLPDEVSEKCIRIVQRQSLRFGAIDMVRDLDGKFWFLECNPNGQWAWIENRTGLPIAAAITDELIRLMS